MNRLDKILTYLFLMVLAFSCKKEHLQPNSVTGSPVFYFKGNVNSSPVNLEAGNNTYYMYSSYTQDVNNVYNYTATLEQIGCTTCSNSIKIIINDYKVTSSGGQETHMDSALAIANYAYVSPGGGTTTVYTINFTSEPDGYGTISSYNWNFGDGQTSTLANPSHKFLHPGAYHTTLSVSYIGGCNSGATDTIGEGTPQSVIHTDITYTVAAVGDSVTFNATTTGGTPPYTYKWKFGNGDSSSMGGLTYNYPVAGQYNASLTTTDANSNTCVSNVQVNPGKDTSGCFVNFTESPIIPDSNGFALSNVTIAYTDANGDVYSSAKVTQPTTSYFKILSVSNYQNNENNQTTKQLHVQFNCLLKDGSGNPLTINNGDAIIAVAYK